MDLKTARFIFNKSQQDVEWGSGVFQTKLSKCEQGLIELTDEEKKRLESFFGLRINWHPKKARIPLSIMEWREIRPLVKHLMKNNKENTIAWAESFETHREFYNAVKEILNDERVLIRNFRYPDGRGVPDMPKIEDVMKEYEQKQKKFKKHK